MKSRLSVILLFTVSVSFLTAQSVTIQNEFDGVLAYVLVTPARYSEIVDEREDPVSFAALFESYSHRIDRIPPRGVRLLSGRPADGFVLVGFVTSPERVAYPVVSAGVGAGSDDVLQSIGEAQTVGDGSESIVSVRSWQVPADPAPVQIDNRYSDWVSVPDFSSFRVDFRPETFSRYDPSPRRELDIGDSLLWPRGGSQLERIKALMWNGRLYLMAAATSTISRDLSVIVRLHPEREAGRENQYTLEIPMGDVAGPVLLWSERSSRPTVVGDFARSSFFVEASIDTARLPASLERLSNGSTSFDIATRISDNDLLEEFHHTTGFVRDIPTLHGSVNE